MKSNQRVIRLHKSDIDAHGRLNIWRIYPTQSSRRRGEGQLRRYHPELNYRVDWKDTQGWGLQLVAQRTQS